mgnify:CR=1 FL=1
MMQRVSALIIKDKKLLLVSAERHNIFWTPGGRLDKGESLEDGLKRELKEELSIELISADKYFECDYLREDIKIMNHETSYFVEFKGSIKPSLEVDKIIWISKNDFEMNKFNLTKDAINIIKKLIHDNYL